VSRAAVVYNPVKVPDPDALRDRVCEFMAAHGWAEPVWLATTADDPGIGMCRTAVEQGCDVVFVAGGDGTVMAAVTAMAGCGTPLALLPAGTGNLLARNLDVPLDEEECLRIGISGRTRTIDVGVVDERKFAVMAGLGFDAAMMRDAPEGLKKAVGWPAYVVSATRHLRGRGIRVSLTIDDGQPMHRRVRTVVVGNVGRLQGNIPLLPDAEPDDGILDVVVIATRNLVDWARVTGRVLRRADVPDRRIERFRATHVQIEASRAQPRQLDGDVIEEGRQMDIRIEPGALQVRVPAIAPAGPSARRRGRR
jgi:YegS/Rv2252/BmrU family lipid kinase